ncbi:MAG: hypothetical protein IT348_17985 [Candidatus Eisenbacteria bacterium]|nr:hypothetical protein [Candidatus Eisenbacteria bacterium]
MTEPLARAQVRHAGSTMRWRSRVHEGDRSMPDEQRGPRPQGAPQLMLHCWLCALGVAWLLSAASANGAPPPSPASPPTLWVIDRERATPYRLDTFRPGPAVTIPDGAMTYPEELAINRRGQMLFKGGATLWLWDGATAATVPATPDDSLNLPAPPGAFRSWLLGNDGASLFVVETFAASGRPGTNQVRVLETDLQRRSRRIVFSYVRLPCQYTDGISGYFECPEPDLWAPGGLVSEFMVLSHWYHDVTDYVPEPDSSEQDSDEEYSGEPPRDWPHGSGHELVFRRDASGDWDEGSAFESSTWMDGAARGAMLLRLEEPYFDGDTEEVGCDSVLIVTNANTATLNSSCLALTSSNYLLGRRIPRALLSPDGRYAALTSVGVPGPNATPALREAGHADSLELARLRRTLAELPATEVFATRAPGAPLLRLLHCELVGWSSDREIVVLEQGKIVAVDIVSGKRRESSITSSSAVFTRVVR